MRRRNKSIPIRVTEKELEEIDARASKAKKNRTEYGMVRAAMTESEVNNDTPVRPRLMKDLK